MSTKQRLYPDEQAVEVLNTHCRHARFIYNLGHEHRLMWRRGKQSIGFNEQCRQLTELRKEEDWLRTGSQQIQSSALRDLDRAWNNFFQNSSHYGKPTWRKAMQHEAFVIQRPSVKKISHKWGAVFIPKHGFVKFRLTRPFREIEVSKSARVSLKAGRWHVSFTALPREFKREATDAVVGVDAGVVNTIATSDGQFFNTPSLSPGEQKRLLSLQRKRAKTEKGSNRRKNLNVQIAKLKAREARRKKDWVEQATTQMVRDYDLIGLEDLKIKNMTKSPAPKPDPENEGQYLPNGAAAKAGLNKSILASGWGMFRTRLEQKAEYSTPGQATLVVPVDPKNTSRECRECHHITAENRESQAVFKCVSCGHSAHADTHAALNIEDRALAQVLVAAPGSEPSLKTGYAVGHTVKGRSTLNASATLTPVLPA